MGDEKIISSHDLHHEQDRVTALRNCFQKQLGSGFQKNKGIGVGGRQVMRNERQLAGGNKTMKYDRGKPKE